MIEQIPNLISSVGFPIAAFLMIYWQNNTTIKDIHKVIINNNELLKIIKEKL